MHRHVGAMRDIIANTIQYSGASMGRLRAVEWVLLGVLGFVFRLFRVYGV